MPKSVSTRLRDKLLKEMKPGSKLISYVFTMKDIKPIKVDKPGKKDVSLNVYEF